ncbi:MAG: hypothetical protein FWH55_03745 [Oscillospiraceae bacterium]|nr:hypothetical protein [Oscillospiraceae bacterium]
MKKLYVSAKILACAVLITLVLGVLPVAAFAGQDQFDRSEPVNSSFITEKEENLNGYIPAGSEPVFLVPF